MDYIKNIIKAIIWPVLLGIGQFFIILIYTFIFTNNIYTNLINSNPDLNIEQVNELYNNYLKSSEYQLEVTNYVNDNALIIGIITLIIYIPLLIYFYKKVKPKFNKKIKKDIIPIFISGISLSLGLNLLIININKLMGISNNLMNSKYLISMIITTGIIGPILEEFVFRGMVFSKLKKFNEINASVIISTLIFAFFHDNISQIIFAFIIGFICVKIYIKYDSLIYPIIFHIGANVLVPVFINTFISFNFIYSIILMIMLFLLFIFTCKIMSKNE